MGDKKIIAHFYHRLTAWPDTGKEIIETYFSLPDLTVHANYLI